MFDFNADNASTARATVASARRIRPIGRSFAFVPCDRTHTAVTGSTWMSTGITQTSADPTGNAIDLAKPTRFLGTRNVRTT